MSFKEFSAEMGPFLQSIISLNRYKTCVEIGVAKGTTTHYLCLGAMTCGGMVYGFDLWDVHGLQSQFPRISTKDDVEAYLKKSGVDNFKLTQINTKTEPFKAVINELGVIDFAFIDGCHSYEGIKNDFDVVYPKLSKYGTIVFHDTLRIDGCREFMLDLRTKYYDGTYDLIDFPWGNMDRRVGISVLVKRSFPLVGIGIDEVCGSLSSNEQIIERERAWYDSEVNKCS